MRIPGPLPQGGTIGITAPSFGATTEPYITRFKEAVRKLTEQGFKVKAGRTCFKSDGLGISTNPRAAARELERFYADPKIDAIISCGGGETMCETVSFLDWSVIKNSPPKWFMGYSDNTNFIFPLATLCGTAGIYGPCVTGFGKPWEQTENDSLALLTGSIRTVRGFRMFQPPETGTESKEGGDPLSPYILTERKTLRTYIPQNGKLIKCGTGVSVSVTGTLLGGCLDVLCGLSGTPLDAVRRFKRTHRSIIWVLEACDYNPMEIRRALWHLGECGWFENAAAFLIGRPLAAWRQTVMGVDQYNAVTDMLARYRAPVIMDADVGHIPPVMPLVIGADAAVTAKGNNLTVEHML